MIAGEVVVALGPKASGYLAVLSVFGVGACVDESVVVGEYFVVLYDVVDVVALNDVVDG